MHQTTQHPTRRRLAALALAAAAVVGVVGATATAASAHGPRGRGPKGTVATVTATGITVTTPRGTLTVTTTASTTYRLTEDGTADDAAVGTYVTAKGTRAADGSLTATSLHVLVPDPAQPKPSSATGKVVAGKVTANAAGTLTVTTSTGPQTVTTSATTKVVSSGPGTSADLVAGAKVEVQGAKEADGSVTASAVHVITATPPDSGSSSDAAAPAAAGADRGDRRPPRGRR